MHYIYPKPRTPNLICQGKDRRNSRAKPNKKDLQGRTDGFQLNSTRLEQTVDLTSLGINVDIEVTRSRRQTRNGLDIGSQSVKITSTGGHTDIPDGDGEAGGGTLKLGVVAERVLGLGNADGQVTEALASISVDLLLGELAELDVGGTVHFTGDLLDTLLDGVALNLIEKLLSLRVGLLASSNDSLSEVNSTLTTFSPMVGEHGVLGTSLDGLLADNLNLGRGVGRELVDGDDNGNTIRASVLDVLGEVHATSAQDLNVLLLVHRVEGRTGGNGGTTTVDLEGTDGSDNNDNVRHEAGGTALDVEETLATHGEVETGFGNDKARLGSVILIGLSTGKLESHLVGQD